MLAKLQKLMIILVGLPASGKSTHCNSIYDGIERVNLDTIKTRSKETSLINELINKGEDLIIDNTNSTIKERKRYIDIAKEHGYKTLCTWISTTKDECLRRNKIRDNGVPDIAIHTIAKRFEEPTYEEGFDAIIKVRGTNG